MAGVGLNVTFHGAYSTYLNYARQNFSVAGLIAGGVDIGWAAGIARGDIFEANGNLKVPLPADVTEIQIAFYGTSTGLTPWAKDAGYSRDGEQMTVTFEGSALADIRFATVISNSDGLDTANRKTFTWSGEPDNGTWVRFRNIDHDNPPVLNTIRAYETQYESRVLAGEKFDPRAVADHTGWSYLRHLDDQEINSSTVEDFDDISTEDFVRWQGTTAGFPTSKMPLSLIVEFHNLTRTPLWYIFPHKATNAHIRTALEYIRDNLNSGIDVFLELSNEVWNSIFSQTSYFNTLGGGNTGHGYGYRAAYIMMVAREVLSGRNWKGVLGTQTVSTGVTNNNIAGIDLFLADLAAGDFDPEFPAQVRTRNDLFRCLAVTTYFGNVFTTKTITAVTKASTGVITSNNHGFNNGDRKKLFFKIASGMVELDDRFVVVRNKTTNTFEIEDPATGLPIDTSGYTTFVSEGNAFIMPGLLFDWMDESEDLHDSNPTDYPTKYNHFAEMLVRDNYDSSFGLTSLSIRLLCDTYVPLQKAIANANGWELIAYEGGNHNVGGSAQLTNHTVCPFQFVDHFIGAAHTPEMARGHELANQNYMLAGVTTGSKFENCGFPNYFGSWPMKRFHGDDNPIVEGTRNFHQGKVHVELQCVT